MPFELGRTLLVMGQVQRRAKRKRAAKEHLDRALEIFESLPAPASHNPKPRPGPEPRDQWRSEDVP